MKNGWRREVSLFVQDNVLTLLGELLDTGSEVGRGIADKKNNVTDPKETDPANVEKWKSIEEWNPQKFHEPWEKWSS